MAAKMLLGELLTQQGLVEETIIHEALRVQVGGNRRLGNILVRMGALSEDQLVETLAAQLGIDITDIKLAHSPEVRKKIPRYLCRKYDVIPLTLKGNNILEVGMADPSDQQAIQDLEQYTGHVLEPRLARQSDIISGIKALVPFSLQDLFSPQASTRLTRVTVAVCFALIILVGGFTYRYITQATYGTVSRTAESTIYKNHDLMLGIDHNGKITLLGHGVFAKGYYSVSFKDMDVLRTFVASRQNDLSDQQRKWLEWAISKAQLQRPGKSVAAAE